MTYFLIIVATVFFSASYWLFFHFRPIRKSAIIDLIVFETTDINIELEDTIIHRIGKRIRYTLFILDTLFDGIRKRLKRIYEKIRRLFGAKVYRRSRFSDYYNERPRNERFFPSFTDWIEQVKRQERFYSRLPRVASMDFRPPLETVELVGSAMLPKRIYVNDSCVIELFLAPVLRRLSNEPPKLSVTKAENGDACIRVEWNTLSKLLEIRLNGIGIDVTPFDPEVQAGEYAYYSWGCAFPHSGIQTLVFHVNLLLENGAIKSRLIHTVKVAQIDHLTSRQLQVFASVAVILGLVSTTIGIAKAIWSF